MKGKLLSELSWDDAASLLAQDKIVVLPIGGGVKEHGHHLPLGTDMFVTGELARRVVEEADVLMLPPLNFAYFPAFVDWPGSVSIGAETFKNFVADILRSYAKHGTRKFLILDGGVSTHYPLTILSYDLHNELGIEVAVTDIRGLGFATSKAVCDSAKGGHADESETSCMLHLRPGLVKMDSAREDYSPSAYRTSSASGTPIVTLKTRMSSAAGTNGDPTRASAEKGRQILEAMVRDVLDFLASFAGIDHA